MLVRRKDDLLVVLAKGVECVEEFFLNLFHLADKLDVINNEQIIFAVFFFEGVCFVALQRIYKISGKFFQGHIMHLFVWIFFLDRVSDSLDQVSFPESCAPIDKEWVVFGAGAVDNGEAGGISKLIESSDDERVEM